MAEVGEDEPQPYNAGAGRGWRRRRADSALAASLRRGPLGRVPGAGGDCDEGGAVVGGRAIWPGAGAARDASYVEPRSVRRLPQGPGYHEGRSWRHEACGGEVRGSGGSGPWVCPGLGTRLHLAFGALRNLRSFAAGGRGGQGGGGARGGAGS